MKNLEYILLQLQVAFFFLFGYRIIYYDTCG